MTFNSAAWAIDGARTPSALARRATHASTNRAQGVVGFGDLKVLPLATPGNGIRIASGVGLVLNRYQGTNVNETYTVSNTGDHTVPASEMPPVSASARSFIVAVTVGDTEFSQVGHPWMPSSIPAGTEATFQYVRVALIQVAAGATRLNVNYPALELARIDIPANTTTISQAMITDLRYLANPRTQVEIGHVEATGTNVLSGANNGTNWSTYERWPNQNVITCRCPDWATTVTVTGFIEGAVRTKAGVGFIRAGIVQSGGMSQATNVDLGAPNGDDRWSGNVGGEISIPANLRGTTIDLAIYARPAFETSKGFLELRGGTGITASSALLQAIFKEKPI